MHINDVGIIHKKRTNSVYCIILSHLYVIIIVCRYCYSGCFILYIICSTYYVIPIISIILFIKIRISIYQITAIVHNRCLPNTTPFNDLWYYTGNKLNYLSSLLSSLHSDTIMSAFSILSLLYFLCCKK